MSSQINWAALIPPQVQVPVYIEGDPGTGKSKTVESLARITGRNLVTFMLNSSAPEDIGGLPVIVEKDGRKVFTKLLDERLEMLQGGNVLAFFDELNDASRANQSAAQQTIVNCPPGCWMFAAGNPIETGSSGVGLTMPMVNRLCFVRWELDVSGWLAAVGDTSEEEIPWSRHMLQDMPVVKPDWITYRQFWRAAVSGFIAVNRNLLQKISSNPEDEGKPYPSTRSWTSLMACMGGCDSAGANEEVRLAIAAGCVGLDAATGLMNFVAAQRLPDPNEVLNDKGWTVPKDAGVCLAVMRSVASLVKSRIERAEAPALAGIWWEKYMDFSIRVFGQSREMGLMAQSAAYGFKPKDYMPQDRSSDSGWAEMAAVRQEVQKSLA